MVSPLSGRGGNATGVWSAYSLYQKEGLPDTISLTMHKLFLAFFVALPAFALFETRYVSFQEPEGWKCENIERTYYCQATKDPERKESLVMTLGVQATEWDSLDAYEKFLKVPKTITEEDGKTPITSKVIYARKRNLNGTVWVDALHFQSELPGFWARYLATVNSPVSILVTYIVSDEYYNQISPQFERMVTSLKVNTGFNAMNVPPTKQGELVPGADKMGPKTPKDLLSAKKSKVEPDTKVSVEEPSEGFSVGFYLIIGGAALLTMVALRSKRKPKKSKYSTPSPLLRNRDKKE